jgi:hypothetical protein
MYSKMSTSGGEGYQLLSFEGGEYEKGDEYYFRTKLRISSAEMRLAVCKASRDGPKLTYSGEKQFYSTTHIPNRGGGANLSEVTNGISRSQKIIV